MNDPLRRPYVSSVTRYAMDAAVAAVIAASCVVIAFGPLACMEPPPSTDAGPDPDISDCCLGLVLPWRDSPQTCLEERTAPGECRWLTCLAGLFSYEACQ